MSSLAYSSPTSLQKKMLHYIITLSTFGQQIHASVKSIGKSLKLLLSQKKLKTAGYTDATFIAEKSALCCYKSKDGASYYLLSFYEMLFFDAESIEQSKQ